ncbi:MAG: mandelate racemase/muconate lactonizing enzyme family protein [Acidobacteria bacterium]|nr:mandelate racemase/muconate lactonizing enzyme family protein [Acidobacteriota bacterium]
MGGLALLGKAGKPTDIRIEDVTLAFEDIRYRFPYKFGGVAVDRATLVNVHCTVRARNGKTAKGFGSMPLGNVWSFPSRTMPYDKTLGAMRALASRIGPLTASYKEYGHPIEINTALEPQYLKAAEAVSKELALDAPIPTLCTLVTASAFDAAVHDAFGKAHGRNCYETYGPDLLGPDLSAFLGKDFRGERLDKYLLQKPRASVNLYHSVGGADPLTAADVAKPVGDGLPETLPEWIRFNGLHHIKIKLQGDELNWDVERVVAIDRIAQETRPEVDWRYCVDFNERCPNVEYLLDFLRRVKEKTPKGFTRIEYIEQPTARDLKSDRRNVMHEAAKLRPVVIDESLTDLETLLLAREMGYTGVALKACKGQSQAMLMAAAGQKYKMFLCVQDLTCPGASLVHSASIASHVPGVSGIEANSRQYLPAANASWAKTHPGLFAIKNGSLRTAELTGVGIGAVPA